MKDWADRGNGCYITFDGQYGSTGKGLLNQLLGHHLHDVFGCYTNNAGPNSGHTAWRGDKKIVLKQLPMGGVEAHHWGSDARLYLNAGAVINRELLHKEISTHDLDKHSVLVHPNAATISFDNEEYEKRTIEKDIGSTAQGVGGAIMDKIGRQPGVVYGGNKFHWSYSPWEYHKTLVEVSQGFSLGINREFYPFCTSRECTPMQAMADLGAPPTAYRNSIVSLRTFPIRVGGNSGPCYPDQEEISFEDLEVPPEYTTVTGRKRRIFTWSNTQFERMMASCDPGGMFINFMNYLPVEDSGEFVDRIVKDFTLFSPFNRMPSPVLLGWGANMSDVELYK